MSEITAGFQLQSRTDGKARLSFQGDWVGGSAAAGFAPIRRELGAAAPHIMVIDGAALGAWDSLLVSTLLQCHDYCADQHIELQLQSLPAGVESLLQLATTVPAHQPPAEPAQRLWHRLSPYRLLRDFTVGLRQSLGFIGDVSIALWRLLLGKASTRFQDFQHFCYQAGPQAIGIISLTSVLVGMILAYLGAAQLRQFGAEIYVADLVVVGMLREMGALMVAIVMAGRTGAAYAAQLGTMQSNDEIDAITTMGISPMEFLVVPRMLALVVVMPLLTVYADLLGMVGGAIVAAGMGITPLQYYEESKTVMALSHLSIGLIKSVVFAALIAVAGCRSGINSGRSSAAVGQAATEAVVTAIVYLIVADAAINILFQQLEWW